MGLFGGRSKDADRAGASDRNPAPRAPAGAEATRVTPETATGPPRSLERADAGRSGRSAFGRESNVGIRPTDKGDGVAHIGKSIIFKGELTGDEDLEIDGNVEGDIKLPNHVLTIGAHGRVKASISAKGVQVVGHVSGNVNATERVEIQASGVVEGDIRAPRLLVQEGAVVNGAIEMSGGKESASAKPGQSGGPSTPGSGQPARKLG